MKYEPLIIGYLSRANDLLNNQDEIALKYCALELRQAIELIVWTQFKDAFQEILLKHNLMFSWDFSIILQPQSIQKMYKLLKRHINDYADSAQEKEVMKSFSSSGNEPMKEEGRTCYIPGELPNRDYRYLSGILHYEKEFDHKEHAPDSGKLKEILKRLRFVVKNYTLRVLIPTSEDEDIIRDITKNFFNER